MASDLRELNDATFDEHLIATDIPVLVDFWAEWCGPCKKLQPVLEEIAREQAGKIEVTKVNVDDSLEIARRFEVLSIPTLILFKDGNPALRIVGAKGKARLVEDLAPYL